MVAKFDSTTTISHVLMFLCTFVARKLISNKLNQGCNVHKWTDNQRFRRYDTACYTYNITRFQFQKCHVSFITFLATKTRINANNPKLNFIVSEVLVCNTIEFCNVCSALPVHS